MTARTEAEQRADYAKFRGRCRELCEAEVRRDPSLVLVRGHVFIPAWPSEPEQAHWWCRAPDGTIVDPSWRQFPGSQPRPAQYAEFNGMVECAECGETLAEEKATVHGRYAFCTERCLCRFVGV